jgi:hypothetical protein
MKKLMGIVFGLGMVGLLAGCGGASSAHHVIYGVVADVDANPVSGVIVTTIPPTSAVSTDKDGRYMIKAVEEGAYTLKASKLGYVAAPAKITARGADFIQGDIRLIPEEMLPAPAPVYVEPAPAAETSAGATPAASGEGTASEAPAAEEKSGKAWWEKK